MIQARVPEKFAAELDKYREENLLFWSDIINEALEMFAAAKLGKKHDKKGT